MGAVTDFVNIETLFERDSDRTISSLANVYENRQQIKEVICRIGKGVLDNEDLIKGKRIFLKPNWVVHDRQKNDNICLRTNNNFILAVVEIILERKPGAILISDAPIQGCDWDKVVNQDFLEAIGFLSEISSIPIVIKDLRRVTFDPEKNDLNKERNPISDYVIFDLGKDSYLEPITTGKNIFRVNNYDPDRLAESHSKGVHKYCITKELFDSDLVISLPKVKTHQKTGITGALKNLVGINGDKDYLPHHRVGGVGYGGDCYPGKNALRRLSEWTLDNGNRRLGKRSYWFWTFISAVLWKISNPKNVHHLSAAWYGNDTTWRMVMDLNRIAVYGQKDGSLSGAPQRRLYSLCDGIVGGQGNGPLWPDPLALGIISFTNNSFMNDICMATLMNFDVGKISLLRTALMLTKNKNIEIKLNGRNINYSELSAYSIITTSPPGWTNYLNEK